MIPTFPAFKKLEITDREEMEKITSQFLPYSDFNFVSLYSWNTNDTAEISILNDNLAVKFLDYATNEPFYTFIGKNEVVQTTQALLDLSKEKGFMNKLKLIPQEVVEQNLEELTSKFSVQEDRDNFDYILSFEKTIALEGGEYSEKRKAVKKFVSDHPYSKTQELNVADLSAKEKIIALFNLWGEQKEKGREEMENELIALNRMFELSSACRLNSLGVFIGERLIAFSINEAIEQGYVVGHFGKYDSNFYGAFEYMEYETAKFFLSKGFKYLNLEQDMGLDVLRKSKTGWNPEVFLKKYIVGC